MKISVVVAVYQNKGSLRPTYERIIEVLKSTTVDNYEFIFVDDGSTDGSLEELLQLKNSDNNVKILSFTRNFGQMKAIIAGFRKASGNAVINISADLQDPVELIPVMISEWQKGAESVIGYRTSRDDDFKAKFFSKLAYSFIRLSLPQVPVGGFDYVLADRKVVDIFNAIESEHRFFQGDFLWSGHKTMFLPYSRAKRTVGKSQYNFSKKMKVFLDAVLDSSYLPIRLMSLIGTCVFFLGVIYAIIIFFGWLFGKTPFPGWAPIMITSLILSGFIMLMLGIIGEYQWRIYDEVRKRPPYIIRNTYE